MTLRKSTKNFRTIASYNKKEYFLVQIRMSKLKDIELAAMNLTAKHKSISSEHQLFIALSDELKPKIERSVYNKKSVNSFPS